jgi:hypothetical protein
MRTVIKTTLPTPEDRVPDNDEVIFEVSNIRSFWTSYIEDNRDVIDNIIEEAGSELKALLFLQLRTLGRLEDIFYPDDEEGEPE